MILAPVLRRSLAVVALAYGILVAAYRLFMALVASYDPPNGYHWSHSLSWLADGLEPLVITGVLLVLLSIDARIERKV